MILFKRAADLLNDLQSRRRKGQTIGFVPTMGALHPGHVSLVEASKRENDVAVSSIFINPSQFNDASDLAKYPVTLASDIEMLEAAGCDLLLLPEGKEVYPPGFRAPHYELGHLEHILEGKFRPGHFQGVCMVVDRLLQMTIPDRLYLGQKDFQQCLVIKKLLNILGLEDSIEVRISPTLREKNGLAMSSRNMRLSKAERERSAEIIKTLEFIEKNIGSAPLSKLRVQATERLTQKGFRVDYVEIAELNSLLPAKDTDENIELVALIAAFNNEIRLIDNLILNS